MEFSHYGFYMMENMQDIYREVLENAGSHIKAADIFLWVQHQAADKLGTCQEAWKSMAIFQDEWHSLK